MQRKPDVTTGQPSATKSQRDSDPANAGASSIPTQTSADFSSTGVIDQAKETISNVASRAGGKVTSRLDAQKDQAAEGLGSLVQALRQTSQQLREQNQGAALHEYLTSATDQVERFSNYVRSANVSQMVNQVEQFARRQPGLFLGGAFVLGLLGARFLKSSGQASSAYSGPTPRGESLVPRGSYAGTPAPVQSYGATPGSEMTGASLPTPTTPTTRGEDL